MKMLAVLCVVMFFSLFAILIALQINPQVGVCDPASALPWLRCLP